MTKNQRYALIRRIARKIAREDRKRARFMKMISEGKAYDDRSSIYWSDESKYVNAHYGEVAYQTLNFERE